MNDYSVRRCNCFCITALLLCLETISGSVVLTQTHPAAPYVCRTGNITLRCQYGGVENVFGVVWVVGGQIAPNASTVPGHTALPRTTTYQEVVVDSYTNLATGYRCEPTFSNGSRLQSNTYIPQEESVEVNISSLTLARRTATTLSVTWSASYPKCYSFTVFHSTQDGSINVTQPADNDTSHTLTSLQPGTTYRIEVEAVRKGDRADGERAEVIGNFTTEDEDTTDVAPSGTIFPTTPSPTASSETAGVIAGVVVGVFLALVLIIVLAVIVATVVLVHRRKTVPGAKASAPKAPTASNESATHSSEDTKQTYAVLDWQNPEQRPQKAPDNEWFTVQYSKVCFDGTK